MSRAIIGKTAVHKATTVQQQEHFCICWAVLQSPLIMLDLACIKKNLFNKAYQKHVMDTSTATNFFLPIRVHTGVAQSTVRSSTELGKQLVPRLHIYRHVSECGSTALLYCTDTTYTCGQSNSNTTAYDGMPTATRKKANGYSHSKYYGCNGIIRVVRYMCIYCTCHHLGLH